MWVFVVWGNNCKFVIKWWNKEKFSVKINYEMLCGLVVFLMGKFLCLVSLLL